MAGEIEQCNHSSCSECGSMDIQQNAEGILVCRNCGIMDDSSLPSFELDASMQDPLQNSHHVFTKGMFSKLGKGQEFRFASDSLQRAVKIDKDARQTIYRDGFFEIQRILAEKQLLNSWRFFDACVAAFRNAYSQAQVKSKCRDIHLLSLVTVYRMAQLFGIFLPLNDLLTCLNINHYVKTDFLQVFSRTAQLFPRPPSRIIIARYIAALTAFFPFSVETQQAIVHLIKKHITDFMGAKYLISAAAIISVAVIITDAHDEFTISSISNQAGVALSSTCRCIKIACAKHGWEIRGNITNSRNRFCKYFGQKNLTKD